MKTNHSIHGIRRIRYVVLCLAVVGLAAGELRLGESMASRFGQVNAYQLENPQAPCMGVADLMAAAH